MTGRTFIIAEAGVNHNGIIENALKLCDIAKSSGADAIKFQTFKTELVLTSNVYTAGYQRDNTGSSSQFQMVKDLELNFESFRVIEKYCQSIGLLFISTPDDKESLDFLVDDLQMNIIKIGSGEVDNVPHLINVAKKKKKTILSTGMATIDEVKNAVDLLKLHGCEDLSILHCTTAYPCAFEDLNLKAIATLKENFQCTVGLSDHSEGIDAAVGAICLGAEIIEKHFTIDKNMPGPDHRASLDPSELKRMVDSIRRIEKALGNGKKIPTPAEIETAKVVRRKIVASKNIEVGEFFSERNLITKRSNFGMSASRWEEIIGKIATRSYRYDDPIDTYN